MVNLIRLKLVNFVGIYNGMDLTEFEIDRSKSNNNIILLLGENGSGKTSIINELTPIPLEHLGARISSRIRENEIGIKELDYLVDGYVLYKIKIVYDPKKTTKCFITKCIDGKEIELNPNGNVDSYLECIENELHMKKSYSSVGYLSGNNEAKNFVSMKPTERSNYISEWMPEISEFMNAFKLSTKIINKLKKDIDNYNKQIGNMSSINYELELNFLNSNISNLNKELEKINSKITQLKVYQNQLEKNVRSDKELEDIKLKFKTETYNLSKLKNELLDKYGNLSEIDTIDPKSFKEKVKELETTLQLMNTELNHFDEKLALLNSEITSSKSMLNTDSRISRLDLNAIYSTIEMNENLLKDIESSLIEYSDKYQNQDIYMDIEDISDIKTILSIVDDKFIQLNNLISLDTIKCMDDINTSMDNNLKEKESIEKYISDLNSKLTVVNNEIYKYEHGNLDTEILMKRPEFCKEHKCGIIEELLKYLNPKDNLQELYDKSKDIQSKIFDYTSRKEEIDETLRNLKNSYKIYDEIMQFLYKNNEKIAKLPDVLCNLFTKSPSDIYIHINEIKMIIKDISEYSSLINKKDDLIKSVDDLNNIKTIVTANSQIELKIKKAITEYDSVKLQRNNLLTEYFELNKKFELFSNAENMINERDKEFKLYNERVSILNEFKRNILICAKSSYIYNSNKNYIETVLNKEKVELEDEILKMNNKRDEMTTFYVSKKQIEKMRTEVQEQFNKINILNKIWSPKVGYPSWEINSFTNELAIKTNNDLNSMWGSNLAIKKFLIDENNFKIEMIKNGNKIDDASLCSQGETKTINTAISFSIIESNVENNGYDVLRLDEVDGALDETRRAGFMEMIQNRINEMGCDSCFIITHNGEFEDIPCDIILLKGANVPEEKLKNKNILFRY